MIYKMRIVCGKKNHYSIHCKYTAVIIRLNETVSTILFYQQYIIFLLSRFVD